MPTVILVWLAASLAHADTYDLGNGQDGTLVVSSVGQMINSVTPLSADAAIASSVLSISINPTFFRKAPGFTNFAVGDLVLVLVSRRAGVPVPGDQTAIDLAASDVGQFLLARIVETSPDFQQLTIDQPLPFAAAFGRTQVVHVPEYTSVSFDAGAALTGFGYDGQAGGVIAFLSQGNLSGPPSGSAIINANGLAGQAALYQIDSPIHFGCTAARLSAALGGLVGSNIFETASASHVGLGNAANAGGGGDCTHAGGGGGAGQGAGGRGGDSAGNDACAGAAPCTSGDVGPARPVGGLGGAPLVYSPLDRLLFGGGGGAGHGSVASVASVGGARGGGIVFARAASMSSASSLDISASGSNACSAQAPTSTCVGAATTASIGGGGGGGGGTIHLRLRSLATCANINLRVAGGSGGSTMAPAGPGGGGGAGAVFVEAPVVCAATLLGGAAGSSGTPWGQTAGSNGSVVALATRTSPVVPGTSLRTSFGFRVVPPPTFVLADGAHVDRAAPTVVVMADPLARVLFSLDGGPATMVTVDASGQVTLPLLSLSDGSHTIGVWQDELGVQSVVTSLALTAVSCLSDAQCGGATPKCMATGVCGCTSTSECEGNASGSTCMAQQCGCASRLDCEDERACVAGSCVSCVVDEQCAGLVCHDARCVECAPGQLANCVETATPFCSAEHCVECERDEQCAGDGRGHACLAFHCGCSDAAQCDARASCDAATASCRECSTDDDCGEGRCLASRCVAETALGAAPRFRQSFCAQVSDMTDVTWLAIPLIWLMRRRWRRA